MRVTSVFTTNRSQIIRLAGGVRLPEGVKHVEIRVRGVERVIAPVGHGWDSFFIDGPMPADDFMDTRASQQQPERESF